MKQYSAHLRERLLGAIDAGLPQAEAARLFGVGLSTITRWRQRRYQIGSVTASPRPGRRRRIGREAEATLVALVQAAPDGTLAEPCAAWGAKTGVDVSVATMSRAAAGGVAAQKKSLIATERDDAARAAWRLTASTLNPAGLVFEDETSTHTALTRRRAREPRGQRAVGRTPRIHGPNMTLLAALTPTGIGPAVTIPAAVDGPPSSPTPSAFSPPAWVRARSWCWTISVPTSVRTPTRPSRPSVAGSSSCRLPRRTSTRSRWPSPRAKRASGLPPSAPPTACSPPPPWPSMPSRPWTPAASPPPAAPPSRPSTMRTALGVAQRSSGGLVAIARTLPPALAACARSARGCGRAVCIRSWTAPFAEAR
jgi:transposase